MKSNKIKEKSIVIVCGHFMPQIGYQEVHLAHAFSKLGYDVKVVTSNIVSASSKEIIKNDYLPGVTKLDEIEVYRLVPNFSIKSFIYSNQLNKTIISLNPHIIIVIGVAKLFPNPLFSIQDHSFIKVTLFGDNSDMNKTRQILKTKILNFFIKKRLYINAIKNSHRVVFYTNDTEKIIKSSVPKNIHSIIDLKKFNSTLGFNSSIFYYSSKEAELIREKYKIEKNTILLITSTRLVSGKKIEKIITAVSKLLKKGIKIQYFMIGDMNNDYSKALKSFINEQAYPNNFTLFPFMNHTKICSYYNAADLGIWSRAAISIQEAMGTGLPIILKNNLSVNHLINNGVNGLLYEESENLDKVLENAIFKFIQNKKFNREKIAKVNYKNLSYEHIAEQMIKDL